MIIITGVIYTVRLKFIQLDLFDLIKSLGHSERNIYSDSAQKGGISQIKTVCMSLGTAMGTGNITGVASAIAMGGAGAVFWMWVSAFFGMAVVYAENSLSAFYGDEKISGTFAYLEKGLKSRFLACFFAVSCVLASFGMGGMVQVNTFSENLRSIARVDSFFLAVAVFAVIFGVVSGGAERTGTSAQFLLPLASVLYAVFGVVIIIKFRENLPRVFSEIFSQAFGFRQTVGGISGYAISVGIRRGIFSNEAGLGSSPILHSSSKDSSPHTQSIWSMFEVFFDTIICCTLTALVILCSDSGSAENPVNTAFFSVMGNFSDLFLCFETAVFAFCTVIGWCYCGKQALLYLSHGRYGKIFCILFSAVSSLGVLFTMKTVWTVSDIFNGLMALPNITALLILSGKVRRPE